MPLGCRLLAGAPSIARPLAEGLSVEVVVTDDRIRALVPDVVPMGFDDAVDRALA